MRVPRARPVQRGRRRRHPPRRDTGAAGARARGLPAGPSAEAVRRTFGEPGAMTVSLAQRPEDVTAEWLSEVLHVDVQGFRTEPVGTGQMADSYRFSLEGPSDPTSVVLKFAAANDTSRA